MAGIDVAAFRKFLQNKGRKRKDMTLIGGALPIEKERRNRYGNKRVVRNGIKFDSIREADRWDFLVLMQKQGVISDLQRQVVFVLIPDEYEEYIEHLKTKDKVRRRRTFIGVRYEADFAYMKDGVRIVEDVKGSKGLIADDAALKLKMMHALCHQDVRIVTNPTEKV